jgi:hypothetical protein
MVWKAVPSNLAYEVSDDGRVRNIITGHLLSVKPHVRDGYMHVKLRKNGKIDGRSVHRLVCEAFHGKATRGKNNAAHRDGDKKNNHPKNVRWASKKENEADKVLHGRHNKGERNGMAILSDKDAANIKRAAASLPRSIGGHRIKKGAIDHLCKKYGVTKACIGNIISGRRKL